MDYTYVIFLQFLKGENGRISYDLKSADNQKGYFSVDATGTVRVSRRLDRESINRFHLVVEARDNGEPVRSSSATAQV